MKKYIFFIILSTVLFSCDLNVDKGDDDKEKDAPKQITRTLPKEKSKLTFMVYYNADNNLEEYMLSDIDEIKRSLRENEEISVIVLIDRIKGYSDDKDVFGEDFTDSRLYEIIRDKAIRVDGQSFFEGITEKESVELDLGDIQNLKKFIEYSKANYSADKYVLVVGNHGSGINEYDKYSSINYAISYDDTDSSFIKIPEFTKALDKTHFVDLLVFDACQMAYAEAAYQFAPLDSEKFSTNFIAAASTEVVAEGFCYDRIFEEITSSLTPSEIGVIFLEKQEEYLKEKKRNNQAYVLLDLSKIKEVKNSLDKTTSFLSQKKEALKNFTGETFSRSYVTSGLIYYFNSYSEAAWIDYANFDIYSFFDNLRNSPNFSDLSADIDVILDKIDDTIVFSFGG
ncbi:MAG TPA: clostripain-related cysteine peptidase, partial [Spirochaetota bacterium]|nr:clostripain-related cysteine peptidase [Spirochaetota bacterium]